MDMDSVLIELFIALDVCSKMNLIQRTEALVTYLVEPKPTLLARYSLHQTPAHMVDSQFPNDWQMNASVLWLESLYPSNLLTLVLCPTEDCIEPCLLIYLRNGWFWMMPVIVSVAFDYYCIFLFHQGANFAVNKWLGLKKAFDMIFYCHSNFYSPSCQHSSAFFCLNFHQVCVFLFSWVEKSKNAFSQFISMVPLAFIP